jgi:putative Holliday junction resolvase
LIPGESDVRTGVRVGIDPGDARIGVARSDPSGFLATPVETVRRGKGDLARLRRIIAEEGAVEVVVGLPRSLSGGEGPAAATVRTQVAELVGAVQPVPVRLVDERLTTVTAAQRLREGGRSAKKQRDRIDAAAAAAILEHALDSERHRGTPLGELLSSADAPDQLGHKAEQRGDRRRDIDAGPGTETEPGPRGRPQG